MFFFLGRDEVLAPTSTPLPTPSVNNVETVSFDEECNTSVRLTAAEHITQEKKTKNALHEGGTADRVTTIGLSQSVSARGIRCDHQARRFWRRDNGTVSRIRLQFTPFILRPFHSLSTYYGGGEGGDENASRRDDESFQSALVTIASIKSDRSKKSLLSSKSARFNKSAQSSALNKFDQKSKDVVVGKSKKKRGVVGLTLVVGVAVGVFVGLYYENRKTVRAEAKAEAAYLADYNGPWYYDEECLSLHERARNLKGDVKTSSVTVLIKKKRDEEVEESIGSVNIIITSGPKPEGVPELEAEPVHPEHYRKCTERDSVYGTGIESSGGAEFAVGPEKKAEVQKKAEGVKAKTAKVAKSNATTPKSKAAKKSKATTSKSKASKVPSTTSPSRSPSRAPSTSPSQSPSKAPSTVAPSVSRVPTSLPSVAPSCFMRCGGRKMREGRPRFLPQFRLRTMEELANLFHNIFRLIVPDQPPGRTTADQLLLPASIPTATWAPVFRNLLFGQAPRDPLPPFKDRPQAELAHLTRTSPSLARGTARSTPPTARRRGGAAGRTVARAPADSRPRGGGRRGVVGVVADTLPGDCDSPPHPETWTTPSPRSSSSLLVDLVLPPDSGEGRPRPRLASGSSLPPPTPSSSPGGRCARQHAQLAHARNNGTVRVSSEAADDLAQGGPDGVPHGLARERRHETVSSICLLALVCRLWGGRQPAGPGGHRATKTTREQDRAECGARPPRVARGSQILP
ncbi:hypothetical protein THAOC_15855 [Thalassiosira oceanica]|uniref:Uncharacterized protein n=1 Tax=Thalassiosira oceanica TaxID=159749 RepID=K0SQY3_THAOC|nr:hypothetical protein THAOC_15855 [Thalassiosira oceanica]|eukprot:EJK63481.1 hypothetical protein THAOC_15855 [Thalassiosira oceanica]